MNLDPCTVAQLATMEIDDTIHPRAFFDRWRESRVTDWAELDRLIVAWLSREGHLTNANLPIHNYAGKGKYYINNKREHGHHSFDADWHRVGEYFVDTKYKASAHVKNILAALEQLGLKDPHFYLAFRKDD
jgi:hypothetical protein